MKRSYQLSAFSFQLVFVWLWLSSGLWAQQEKQHIYSAIPDPTRATVGQFEFLDKQATPHKVTLQAPDAIAADLRFTLPGSDAHGCIVSDGSGNWSVDPTCSGLALPFLMAADFVFTRTNGSDATGTLTTAGANTITFTSCPGNATDVGHWYRISGGTGTEEPLQSLSGTCVTGAAGTMDFSTTTSHAGAWTVTSAACGIPEAMFSAPGGSRIAIAAGVCKVYGPIDKIAAPVYFFGAGEDLTVLSVAAVGFGDGADFPLSETGVFEMNDTTLLASSLSSGGVSDLTFQFYQNPANITAAAMINWPAAVAGQHVQKPMFSHIRWLLAWDGLVLNGDQGFYCLYCSGSQFHRGFDLDTMTDSSRIVGFHNWPFNTTANLYNTFQYDPDVYSFWIGRADDLKIEQCATDAGSTADLHSTASGDPWVTISDCDLDNGRVSISAGKLLMSNVVMGGNTMPSFNGITASRPITVTGTGELLASNSTIGISDLLNTSNVMDVDFSASGFPDERALGSVILNDIRFYNNRDTVTLNIHSTGDAGVVIVNGSHFNIPNAAGTGYASCVINATGPVKALIAGVDVTSKIDHTGAWFCADTDSGHVVNGNSAVAWSMTYPPTQQVSRFADNSGITNPDPVSTAVASASTIQPTGEFFHITGSASIGTILTMNGTTPAVGNTVDAGLHHFRAVFDSTAPLITGGNIAAALHPTVGQTVAFDYDSGTSLWYTAGGVPSLYFDILPAVTNTYTIGNSGDIWAAIYANVGSFAGNVTFGGNLLAATNNVSNIGDTAGNRFGIVAAYNFNGAPSGTTGNYVSTRELVIYDKSGAVATTPFWNLQTTVCCGVGATSFSHIDFFDPTAAAALSLNAVSGGSADFFGEIRGNFFPSTDGIYNLGCQASGGCSTTISAAHRWLAGNFSGAVSAASVITGSVSTMQEIDPGSPGSTTLGNSGSRWGDVYTTNLNVSGTCTGCGGSSPELDWAEASTGILLSTSSWTYIPGASVTLTKGGTYLITASFQPILACVGACATLFAQVTGGLALNGSTIGAPVAVFNLSLNVGAVGSTNAIQTWRVSVTPGTTAALQCQTAVNANIAAYCGGESTIAAQWIL